MQNKFENLVALQKIKAINPQELADKLVMLSGNPDALTNDVGSVDDYNAKVSDLKTLVASLEEFN